MKFSDIDNQLDEAPDLSKIKGKLQRAGTKLKQHTPFNKEARLKAKTKSSLQQTALGIKDEFHEWQAETGSEQTAKEFLNFLGQKYPSYVQAAKEMAVKLGQMEKEPTPDAGKGDEELSVSEPKAQPDDSAGQKADEVDPNAEQEDMISPEEMTGEKGEEDEVEEEVDMSASIYESRLAYFLIENAKLKDNQLDTLIFRTLQAVKKAGGSVGSKEPDDEVSKAADKVSKAKAPDDEEMSVARPSYDKLSSNDIEAIKKRIDEFGDDIKDIIRRQDGIEDSIKKEMSNKIDNLVYDMISDSF